MEQKINLKFKQDLPIKYELGLHQVLPSYPTETDFIVDVVSYIARVCEVKQKEFDTKDLKFSAKTLKYIFTENDVNQTFKDRLRGVIKSLIEKGDLTKKGEFLYINQDTFNKLYQ
jgi:hypothetical protein